MRSSAMVRVSMAHREISRDLQRLLDKFIVSLRFFFFFCRSAESLSLASQLLWFKSTEHPLHHSKFWILKGHKLKNK